MGGARGGGTGGSGTCRTPTPGGSRRTAAGDLVRLADARLDHGHCEEAAGYYHEALRADPKNQAALSGLGNAFIELGRYDEAHDCFRTILEASPNSPAALAGMGDLCMKLVKFDRAVTAYDMAIAAGPVKIDTHNGRGEALKNLGRFEEACGSFAAALKCDGDDITALFMLGECFFAMSRPRDALHFFGRVYALSPDMAGPAMHNIAGCLAALNRHEEAITSFEKALEHDDEDWDSVLGIASSLGSMGRGDAAMEMLDHAIEDGPEDAAVQALLFKSRIFDACGQNDMAIEACDMVVEIDGLNTEALLRKGRILSRSGRRLAALACISAATVGDPHHTRAARDAVVVTRALERAGGLPWMWKRAGKGAGRAHVVGGGRRSGGGKIGVDGRGRGSGRKAAGKGGGPVQNACKGGSRRNVAERCDAPQDRHP